MDNYFKKIKSPRGFGMLEMVIALGILMMGVIGFSTLTMATIVTSRTSELRIVAANLAREGIEVARNIRDSNWLKIDAGQAGVSWNKDLFYVGGGVLDYTAVAEFKDSTGVWVLFFPDASSIDDNGAKIYYDTLTSLYLQHQPLPQPATIKETPFKRLITLNPICRDGSGNEQIIIDSHICSDLLPLGSYSQVGIDVVSYVKWGEAGRTHEIKQEERLYNWRIGVQ